MVKNLLSLTERRLERVKQERQALLRAIQTLKQEQQDIHMRVHALEAQSTLYEQSAELTRDAFFERQRHKAALLAEVARLLYQQENLNSEQKKLEQQQRLLQQRLIETNNRYEKFQSYLKRERIRLRLNLALQQQYEIEELSTYGGDKTGT